MNEHLFSTVDAARAVGVTEFRLAYAHRAGHLPEPTYKVANKRVYTESDLERVVQYFKTRKQAERSGGRDDRR